MKVTLVYCAVGIAGFNPDRPLGDREGGWIGHGIASIGAQTKAQGHEVDLIDLRQLAGWEEFVVRIEANPAEVYGLSVAPVDYPSALQAVYHIKTTVPKAKIIIGGIHPSIFPEEYDYKVIDTVVTGEGEITFPKLLKNLNNLPKRIQGEKPDLDAIMWADRELFDYKRELSCNFAPDQKIPSITMIAGRGCPYHCNYCQPAENAVFGKPHRMRSAQDVIAELTQLKMRYDFQSITFWDDTFTFNRKWVMEFCDLYERTGINVPITVCSRADIICNNEAMVKRMAEVGVDWFVIGMETGSQRLLDLIEKGTTVEQNIRAGEICRKYGIKIFGTFMYGLPTETREESDATATLIARIAPELASPFWFNPIKGTKLYDYCVANDLLLEGSESRSVARTGMFRPAIKGVDYDHLTGFIQNCGTY